MKLPARSVKNWIQSPEKMARTVPGCRSDQVAPPGTEILQFYAYLTSLVDQEIMKVLRALDHNHFTEKTLIVRISDHGDMAMAHGMQRQKILPMSLARRSTSP